MMQSNFDSHFLPEQPGMRLFSVLAILVMLAGAGMLLGSLATFMIANGAGFELVPSDPEAPRAFDQSQRIALRFALMLNNLCTFLLPGLATTWLLFRTDGANYLRLRQQPASQSVTLAFLWLIVSVPLIQYSYYLNQLLPLPDWMTQMENQNTGLIEAMLGGDNILELLLTVLALAVVPALGEEVVFRGILQQELEKRSRNLHLGVWVSAFIFSSIHFQFAGFLPRFMLGALLGYTFAWTRNLWVPIVLHFFFNGFQVVGSYFVDPSDFSEQAESAAEVSPSPLLAIGSALLIWFVGRQFYRQSS